MVLVAGALSLRSLRGLTDDHFMADTESSGTMDAADEPMNRLVSLPFACVFKQAQQPKNRTRFACHIAGKRMFFPSVNSLTITF